jgi:hypothetical protein
VIHKCDAAPTQFVESRGHKSAFHHCGKESEIALMPLTHFRVSMEDWDPKWWDDSAHETMLIVFGNRTAASGNDVESPISRPYPDSGLECSVQRRELAAEYIRIFLDRSFDD